MKSLGLIGFGQFGQLAAGILKDHFDVLVADPAPDAAARAQAIGVGFGAAFLLGVKDADAAVNTEAAADVTSTNPALDEILAEAKEAHAEEGDEGEFLSAQRRYRRGYRRYGRAYRRGYRRVYRRGYRRYGRVYRRGYRRGYRRFYARF